MRRPSSSSSKMRIWRESCPVTLAAHSIPVDHWRGTSQLGRSEVALPSWRCWVRAGGVEGLWAQKAGCCSTPTVMGFRRSCAKAQLYTEPRRSRWSSGCLGLGAPPHGGWPTLLANPPDDVVYAGCFPGLTIVCTAEAAVDRPSQLDPRFLKEALGRTVYLHAMHSVVDWLRMQNGARSASLCDR
jgi:hypothetical protein